MNPRTLARIAGALYLLNIILGAFAIGFASNNQALYRPGLAAHLIVLLTNVPLAIIFYDLFKIVSRRLALAVAFFLVVGTAIESATLLNQVTTPPSYSIYTAFFGCYAVALGWLILRSTFLPRGVGALLAIGGLSYLTYSFASVLAPDVASRLVPYIQLPSLLGEGSLCLLLLVGGLNATRWNGLAGAMAKTYGKAEISLANLS